MPNQYRNLEFNSRINSIIYKTILLFLVVGSGFLLFSLIFMQFGNDIIAQQTIVISIGFITIGIIAYYFPFLLGLLEQFLMCE
jgi:hypothetical protein